MYSPGLFSWISFYTTNIGKSSRRVVVFSCINCINCIKISFTFFLAPQQTIHTNKVIFPFCLKECKNEHEQLNHKPRATALLVNPKCWRKVKRVNNTWTLTASPPFGQHGPLAPTDVVTVPQFGQEKYKLRTNVVAMFVAFSTSREIVKVTEIAVTVS